MVERCGASLGILRRRYNSRQGYRVVLRVLLVACRDRRGVLGLEQLEGLSNRATVCLVWVGIIGRERILRCQNRTPSGDLTYAGVSTAAFPCFEHLYNREPQAILLQTCSGYCDRRVL